jgi:hypothetical protein
VVAPEAVVSVAMLMEAIKSVCIDHPERDWCKAGPAQRAMMLRVLEALEERLGRQDEEEDKDGL